MARFLIVVPPLVGHVKPAVSVAAELTARGHDVAWAGAQRLVAPLAGPDALVFACAHPDRDSLVPRTDKVRGLAALKLLWSQFLIPLAELMAPGVRAAIAAFEPDVLLVDQQAIAGALIADEAGLPWATSATTSGELLDPLAAMPLVAQWLDAELAALRTRVTGRRDSTDPRFSPYLTLVFSTAALVGAVPDRGGTVHMVGPAVTSRPAPDFPWDWLEPARPTVLVSIGTVSGDAGSRFLDACRVAVAARPHLRAVLVDRAGTDRPPEPDLLVRERVPQVDLLPHVNAVICHAGHNTVCESLLHGVPLVVAPIRDDQTTVAQQVVNAGAGVRLRFNRADAAQIGAALDDVLDDPRYADAARRVGASFRAAGGERAAATLLERLAPRRPSRPVAVLLPRIPG